MIELEIIDSYSEPLLEGDQSFSFLNFSSIGRLTHGQSHPIAYFCDGMLLSYFLTKMTGRKIARVSFDFSSIADQIFQYAARQGKSLYVVGAQPQQLATFIDKLNARYPELIIAGQHHGYFDAAQAQQLHAQIRDSRPDLLLVGLGAGLQERFIRQARALGFGGVAFSCGGFIRQEAMNAGSFYPHWVDRLNLRAFYRMYKEPHTIRRYLFEYPTNFLRLLALMAGRKVTVNVRPAESPQAMNILFVLKDFKADGGVERVQQRLAEQFIRDGHRVGFFIMNGDGAADCPGGNLGLVNGRGNGPAGMLGSILRLRRLIRAGRVDHLIAAKERANLCAWFATLGSGCKVIYSRHAALDSGEQLISPALLHLLYAFYLLGRGRVVTVSHTLRQSLGRRLPWGRQRIGYCPNAVITEHLYALAEAPPIAPPPQEYVLAVGRLIPEKGFDLLLEAYAMARQRTALPELLLVGDGPLRAALNERATQLGIQGCVQFCGFLANPYPLIRHARLLVLSSRHEGLPSVLIEALALGTPVLACDCETGPRELLDHGRLGILVRANDAEALAQGLVQALSVKSRPASAGHAVEQYTGERAAQAYYRAWGR